MADAIGTAFIDVVLDPSAAKGQVEGLASSVSGSLGGVGAKIAGFASSLGPAGVIAGAAVAGAAVVGKALYGIGSEVDAMSDTIRTATGKSGKDLDALVTVAKGVAGKVPESFQTVGDAVGALAAKTGLSGKPLGDMAEQMLNLTRIAGGDLKGNITAVTRMLGDAGLSGAEAAKGIDKLYRASTASGVPVARLAELLTKFGSPMRALGFSFTEQAALLAKFEKEGVNTELVMGSMRIALGKLAKESAGVPKAQAAATAAQKEWQDAVKKSGAGSDEAGVKLAKYKDAQAALASALKAGDAPKALRAQMDAIKGAGTASEATGLAIKLFGARAGPDMAAAIREGRFEIDALTNTIDNGKDSVNSAAKDTADFSEKWAIFSNNMKLLVLPAANLIFDGMNAIGNVLVDNVAPALADVTQILGQLGPVFKIIGQVYVSVFLQAIGLLRAELVIFSGAIKVVADVLRGDWTQAWEDAKATVQGVVDIFTGDFQRIIAIVESIVGPIGSAALAAGKAVLAGILDPIKPLLAAVQGVISSVVGALRSGAATMAGLATSFLSAGRAIMTGLVNGIKALYGTVTSSIAQTRQLATAAVASAATWLVTGGRSVITGLVNGIKAVYGTVTSAIAATKGLATAATSAAASWLPAAGRALIAGLVNGIKGAGGSITGALGWVKQTILGYFSGASSWLYNAGVQIIQGLADGIRAAGQRAIDAARSIVDQVKSIASNVPIIGGAFKGAPAPPPAVVTPQAGAATTGVEAYGSTPGGGGVVGYTARATPKIEIPGLQALGAGAGPIEVRVYIGDTELRGLVRTEIRTDNRNTTRVISAGRR